VARVRPLVPLFAAALLAAPGGALADVPIAVPPALLGGPIGPAVPPPLAAPGAPAPTAEPVADPAVPDGVPSRPPVDDLLPCGAIPAGVCVTTGEEATLDIGRLLPGLATLPADPGAGETPPDFTTPGPGAAAGGEDAPAGDDGGAMATAPVPALLAMPPAPAEAQRAAGGLRTPPPADWLRRQRPVLGWSAVPGARFYNVQVFRGPRRVMNAWSRATSLRVPPGVLDQGRPYVWVVWPGAGTRARVRFGAPVGRSTFRVVLRPRLVFRRPGRGAGVVAETRPRIPGAVLRLTAPAGLTARVPRRVVADDRGLIALPVPRAAAERLRASLVDRGPRPPLGLRG